MKQRLQILVVVVALFAAACGGGSEGSDGVASIEDLDTSGVVDVGIGDGNVAAGSAPTSSAIDGGDQPTDEEALLAFSQCMRDEGIDIPDPTVDADGNVRLGFRGGAGGGAGGAVDREALRAGFAACGELIEGVAQRFRQVDQTAREDQLLAFAQCVRDNGYEDMPDPDVTALGPGQGGGPFGQLARDDPDFQAAAEACQDLLAGFGQGPGGGGRGGPGGGGGNG